MYEILCVFALSFLGVLSSVIGLRYYSFRDLLDSWKNFVAIFFLLQFLWVSGSIQWNYFTFLEDWRFYLLLGFNIANQLLIRVVAKANENNMTLIQLAMTLTPLIGAPLLVFYLNDWAGFTHTLMIQYEHEYEVYALTAALILLCSIYTWGKVKSGYVQRPVLLSVCVILSAILPVFTVKMMQIYHAPTLYMMSILALFLIFSFRACHQKQWKHYAGEWWLWILMPIIYVGYSQMNIIVSTTLAAETSVIMRCGMSVLIGAAFDYFLHKKLNLCRKDALVVAIILGLSSFMLLRTI
ncbi:hypothetical protein [Neptuniibacter sp. QD37_11]|uniref:hypothetical protein n=1 Tax=Neptuniibacter sp. QD37_11 TaxID=3398209 RepID=UPI0039F4EC58